MMLPTRSRESEWNVYGVDAVIGVDEVGRGSLAGPVVVAACILPTDIAGIKDSKLLSHAKREQLYDQIVNSEGAVWSVKSISNTCIDEINILQATFRGMREAVNDVYEQSGKAKNYVALIDGHMVPSNMAVESECIIKGDMTEYIIAAASILAKVTRDRMLVEISSLYPVYNFAKNKGYGTGDHLQAIKTYGPCALHRLSYKTFK